MPETRVIAVNPARVSPAEMEAVVDLLRRGGVAAIPTDSMYALAGRLDLPETAARLREAGTPARLLAGRDGLRTLSPSALRLTRAFWPGPLTLVTDEGAWRCPNAPIAREIARRVPEPLGVVELEDAHASRADLRLDAGPTRQKSPSTVVKVGGPRAEPLREGAIPRSMIEEADLYTILFVCTGNTCRSPMAEALMRKLLADRLQVREDELAAKGYRVLSAGTGAARGGAATEEAEAAVRAFGADLSRHSSQPVSMTLIEEADRVYVMTPRHKRELEEWMPEHAAKIQPLDPAGGAVEDPIGGSAEVYRASAQRIHAALVARLPEIP
jgi:protein-tyrosine-phosphatase/tRNA A37 threonylcarbamoyladenosine synthetase subunit TsaC/SUA5/YrdC